VTRVKVLPAEISQKIAAGEVIERPASVVKELVENSLDAGATEVSVDLVDGGKRLIRVEDNGTGMSREDAELAFVRHSTSKIAREEDLLEISTLGFRGEALPSISSISRLTLKTSEGGEAPGTEVEREGERTLSVKDFARRRGTTVEVRDLFFNLPVRQKFLRGDRAELNPIVKYLTSVALAYPGLRLSLANSGRVLLSCPPVGGLRERIFQLFGKSTLEKLMEVDSGGDSGRLTGFSSLPPFGRSDRTHQHFFVNGRPVRDVILSSALHQAYRGILEKDLSPEAFLFLSLPYGDVDVNVHPAKAEVRFRHSSSVYEIVLRAVEQARAKVSGIKPIASPGNEDSARGAGDYADRRTPFRIPEAREPLDRFFRSPLGAGPDLQPEAESGRRVLGQYANSYIVVEDKDGLLVIDQHNAHERVLFERYSEIDRRQSWPVKLSLIPLLFDLSPSQALDLEANEGTLLESGFRVEAMGGRSFALREFPEIFQPEEALAALSGILEDLSAAPPEGKKDKILATMACKTAIKAGEPLLREKMEFLVAELFKTANPSLCPHGRPIQVRIARSQIEKGLRRR